MLSLRPLAVSLVLMGSLLLAQGAAAGTIVTVLEPFTGSPSFVRITLDDDAGDGSIGVTAELMGGTDADLRGVFLNISDDSLLPGLVVTGSDVTSYSVTGDVINLGHGANLNGGGSPCPCDLGVEIGTAGASPDYITSTFFSISHGTENLSLSLFEDEFIGARITSVQLSDGGEGSAKLAAAVPEPSTALLLGLGLLGLAGQRRRLARG